jgi:hypothetical protein
MIQPHRITDEPVAQQATEGRIEYNKQPKIKYFKYENLGKDWATFLHEQILKNIYDIDIKD